VPTLNERPDDIPLLANHFITEITESNGKPPMTFEEGTETTPTKAMDRQYQSTTQCS
jgi:DNA-binding NtrC family response regulator